MDLDLSRLADSLHERGLDGHLLDASSRTADQLYLSGFDAPDPFVSLTTPETTALLVSTLEYERAKTEGRAEAVRRLSDYDFQELVEEYGSDEAGVRAVGRFLDEFDVASVSVDRRFPLATADGLREQGYDVEADLDDVVEKTRAVKSPTEIAYISEAQRANEAAMRTAESMIADATVVDGVLHLDGEPLTSERVRYAIEATLLEHDCGLDETIVASGPDGAVPHNRGSGPIRVDEPVIVDIFPQDKTSRYHADMTRTFLRGTPDDQVSEMYELTQEAKQASLDAVEAGATGEAVHAAACEVYEDAGYPTLRTDPAPDSGYIHSTGHGVGLEVHERPHVSQNGTEELEPGHVITIEPGLYDPAVGGVRLEDMVVVTEDGYENLTDYPESLVVRSSLRTN